MVALSQRRLELLMQADRAILSELSMTTVLRQIASSARDLVDARYAAVGVVGTDGEPAELVHVGTPDDAVRRNGGLAADHGLLGVPITVRDAVHANLYLSEPAGGGGFTAEDRAVLDALGVTAGFAIQNSWLYEDSQRRQHWAEAVAQVSSALLDPSPGDDPVALIADTVLALTRADVVSVVVPASEPGTFRVQLARGVRASEIEGMTYPALRSVAALALATGKGVRMGSQEVEEGFVIHLRSIVDVGAVLGLPLHGSEGSRGALVVVRRHGRPAFDLSDLVLSESFAAQAALAMELAQARADQQQLVVLQDRERIARDLHDHVIQRLYALGLTLEGLAGSSDPVTAPRLVSVVDDLDVTVRQIRNLIFRLQASETVRTLRSAVLEVTDEATPGLGFDPDVSFEGPVDTLADEALVGDVEAVCREALSNVVRHARASSVSVRVTAFGAALTVVVSDDGIGLDRLSRRSGLHNLERRALQRQGSCRLSRRPAGGTVLRWSIPLT
ncbi:GAF domain-containing sensor histidine kinase [Microlunatus antarcticus]|uniref:Signal transduction histidine kinase n=1 Tax=Microlunatus antarcticus TaxID=53388 RepID=A0A7W5JV20_9ACTN|nr:signal transduction histidine kinase [Microlunatus antarcticus]